MANRIKTTLDFFPVSSRIDEDNKMIELTEMFGIEGIGLYVMLAGKCHGTNGYYLDFSNAFIKRFSRLNNISSEKLQMLVIGMVKIGLFDEDLFQSHKILTSLEIQDTYCRALKRSTQLTIKSEFLLLQNPSDFSNLKTLNSKKLEAAPKLNHNVTICEHNDNNMEQKKRENKELTDNQVVNEDVTICKQYVNNMSDKEKEKEKEKVKRKESESEKGNEEILNTHTHFFNFNSSYLSLFLNDFNGDGEKLSFAVGMFQSYLQKISYSKDETDAKKFFTSWVAKNKKMISDKFAKSKTLQSKQINKSRQYLLEMTQGVVKVKSKEFLALGTLKSFVKHLTRLSQDFSDLIVYAHCFEAFSKEEMDVFENLIVPFLEKFNRSSDDLLSGFLGNAKKVEVLKNNSAFQQLVKSKSV